MMTEQQSKILHYIDAYQRSNNSVSPSYDNMRKHMGLASKSGINRIITALEERGMIRKGKYQARALTITKLGRTMLSKDYSMLAIKDVIARRIEDKAYKFADQKTAKAIARELREGVL